MSFKVVLAAFIFYFVIHKSYEETDDIFQRLKSVTESEVERSLTSAKLKEQLRISIENAIRDSVGTENVNVNVRNVGTSAQIVKSSIKTRTNDLNGNYLIDFTKSLCKRKDCSEADKENLWKVPLPKKLQELCHPKEIDCSKLNSKYRTMDGTCNNLRNPLYGSAFTPQIRFLRSRYGDGISEPRSQGVNGKPLPSPRLVSSVVSKDFNSKNKKLTALLTFFAQILDHDLSLTPITTANGTEIKCCEHFQRIGEKCIPLKSYKSKDQLKLYCLSSVNENVVLTPVIRTLGTEKMLCCPDSHDEDVHPACLPIHIPDDDPFYSKFNQKCMEFVRSSTIANPKCRLGVREQQNSITAFLDGSFVYGSSEEMMLEIRSGYNGTMEIFQDNLLPRNHDECDESGEKCLFFAGDERVNENPALAFYHVLFLREHNRIAAKIKEERSSWSDERIFQEARKIFIAKWQNIVYSEFLPLVVGLATIKKYDLRIKRIRQENAYNDKINPSIRNAFSTAAFRFGHTLLGPSLKFDFDDFPDQTFPLHTRLNNPFDLLNKTRFNALLKGLSNQCPQNFDVFVTSEVTNRLFQEEEDFGLDLVSLNIQRGRDHGLPSYNEYRKFCHLPPIEKFSQMPGSQSCCFNSVYDDVDDIDLFVGGLSELPVEGGVVGPTFACLIGQQFHNLMKGDRFFFTHGNPDGHLFTDTQIREFRKATLAEVLCENTNMKKIQPRPFLKPDSLRNSIVSCDAIQGPNLEVLIPKN